METQAVEIIEIEVVLEEAMSLNHARLTSRITWLLSAAYEEKYDVLAELEFELSTGRLKPDVCILPKLILVAKRNAKKGLRLCYGVHPS